LSPGSYILSNKQAAIQFKVCGKDNHIPYDYFLIEQVDCSAWFAIQNSP
jgi:hypothetical protein